MDMMHHYRVGDGGHREHSTMFSFFPSPSPFIRICIYNQTHASMHCAKDMPICMHSSLCNFGMDKNSSTEALISLPDMAYTPSYKLTNLYSYAAKRHTDEADMQGNLPPLLYSISVNLHFFLTFPHTYIYSHIHTQSTHSISSTSTQQEATWTKRPEFTLLEELEPLRVETEKKYYI